MVKLSKQARKALQDIGRAGGKAKARNMTAKQRKQVGKMLAEARAKKRRERER